MTLAQLTTHILEKKSFLCVGLDIDLEKIPAHLLEDEDPIFAFAKAIIDATHDLCVAYKPNTAFFEAHGVKGWQALEKIIKYLNKNYPDHFTIADAKRGDIGNTSTRYAKAFFEELKFDSVTVAPYMGKDSIEPFLTFKNKYAILLGLTSNEGAFDFQTKIVEQQPLYQQVIKTASQYKNSDKLMYVVGATKATYLKQIRKLIPNAFLLIPGIGAQGGSLKDVVTYGKTKQVGLLVNSSRGIIYASQNKDFAQAARIKALELQQQMSALL